MGSLQRLAEVRQCSSRPASLRRRLATVPTLPADCTAPALQHWPGFFLNAFSNDAHLEGLAQVGQRRRLAVWLGCSRWQSLNVAVLS